MKQRLLVALLAIIALVIPNTPCTGQSNTYGGILDSGSLRYVLSQSLTDNHMAGQLQGAGKSDTDSSRLSQPLRWTVSTEALIFERLGTAKWALVERIPGDVHFFSIPATPSSPVLNSTDLDQGYSPGFRVAAIYHADPNHDIELSFFRIAEWGSTESVGPDNPLNWLVMYAPGGFFQTQDFAYQSMTWDYSTQLYNAELNVQKKISKRISILAGFRWLQLNENLQGTIPPADVFQPTWKSTDLTLFEVAQITTGTAAPAYPPFWNTSTINNLYGLQIGADAKLFERGRICLNGLIKVGEYWNHASESTEVSIQKKLYNCGGSTDNATFVGQAGLQCKYQITKALKLKLGYEALWLNGVALAPGQIKETKATSASVFALGVNSSSNVLFYGFSAGLEFSF